MEKATQKLTKLEKKIEKRKKELEELKKEKKKLLEPSCRLFVAYVESEGKVFAELKAAGFDDDEKFIDLLISLEGKSEEEQERMTSHFPEDSDLAWRCEYHEFENRTAAENAVKLITDASNHYYHVTGSCSGEILLRIC